MHIDTRWDWQEPTYLCSDLGGMDGGIDTGGGGFGGGMDIDNHDVATIDTASIGAGGGMQFDGADMNAVAATAMEMGAAALGAVVASGPVGGTLAGIAGMLGAGGAYLDHASALGVALEHAVHDIGSSLNNDPGLSMGMFGTEAIDIAMNQNGGIAGADNLGGGMMAIWSANGQMMAIVSAYSGGEYGGHEGGCN